MAENIAAESARAFAEMSEHSQVQCIDVTTTNLMLLDNRNVNLTREAFEKVAEELLSSGYLEAFTGFGLEQRICVMQEFLSYSTPIELFILLHEMKNDVQFQTFREGQVTSFQEFDTNFFDLFFRRFDSKFSNPGTEDFHRVLHRYFEEFGGREEIDPTTGMMMQRSGQADKYMAMTALVMRSVYGERRVMLLLDKMIRDRCPIRALDFIKLIKSNAEYSRYPLAWAVALV